MLSTHLLLLLLSYPSTSFPRESGTGVSMPATIIYCPGCLEEINIDYMMLCLCYDFSYFVLFTYVFSLFLEVSHGATALTHFSLTHSTAVVLTHSIAILIHQEINKNLMLPYESYIRTVRLCKV